MVTRRELESKHSENLGDLRDLCRVLTEPRSLDVVGKMSAAWNVWDFRVTPALVADLIDLIPQDKETTE